MWLGHLESEVNRWGHSWVLRTLKANEELEASLIAKEFQDTYGQVKASIWATLAGAIAAVDGQEDFCPVIGPNSRDNLRARFHFIADNWYWPVAEFLFGEYTALIKKQAEALDAIDSLSQRSLRTSWPSQDSSKEQGDSEEILTPSSTDSQPISSQQMKTLVDSDE